MSDWEKAILALPLLPSEEIEPTFNQLILLPLVVSTSQASRISELKRYLSKNWIKNTSSCELSVYTSPVNTNNGAESYDKKIKAYIKTPHPRIWSFLETLNNIIADYDAELDRISNGIEITRIQSKKERDICHLRTVLKERIESREITPLQYLFSLGEKMDGPQQDIAESESESEDDDNNEVVPPTLDLCVVCLQPRNITVMFLPCQHCNTCQNCSDILGQVDGRCPVCRSRIDQRLIAYQ